MCPRSATKVPAFHHTGETTALGFSDNIYLFTSFEDIHTNRLAHFKFAGIVSRNLPKVPTEFAVFQMTGLGLIAAFNIAEA